MASGNRNQKEATKNMSRKQLKEQFRRQRMRHALNRLKEMLFQLNDGHFDEHNSKLEDADVLEGAIRMLGNLLIANAQLRQEIIQSHFAGQFLFHQQQMTQAMRLMPNGIGFCLKRPNNNIGEMQMANSKGTIVQCRQQSSSNNIAFFNQNFPPKISVQNRQMEEWSDVEELQLDVIDGIEDRAENGKMANGSGNTEDDQRFLKGEEQDSGIVNDLDDANNFCGNKENGGGKMKIEKRRMKKGSSHSHLWRPYT